MNLNDLCINCVFWIPKYWKIDFSVNDPRQHKMSMFYYSNRDGYLMGECRVNPPSNQIFETLSDYSCGSFSMLEYVKKNLEFLAAAEAPEAQAAEAERAAVGKEETKIIPLNSLGNEIKAPSPVCYLCGASLPVNKNSCYEWREFGGEKRPVCGVCARKSKHE
jgi:hypothetical protein